MGDFWGLLLACLKVSPCVVSILLYLCPSYSCGYACNDNQEFHQGVQSFSPMVKNTQNPEKATVIKLHGAYISCNEFVSTTYIAL